MDCSASSAVGDADDSYRGNELRGVSVYHLQAVVLDKIRKLALSTAIEHVTVHDIVKPIIRKIGKDIVCPRDKEMGAAYVDCIYGPENAGKSDFMLSYTWKYRVQDIADTLGEFCEQQRLDVRSTYVWICCFCVNQHRVDTDGSNPVPFDKFAKTFSGRVEGIGHVLAMLYPWNNPEYVKRVWCDFELFTAVRLKKELTILTPPAERKSLRDALLAGSGVAEVWKVLIDIDIRKAQASIKEDKTRILKLIQEECGFEKLNMDVSKHLRQWIVDTSEREVRENMSAGNMSGAIAVKMCTEVGELFTNLDLEKADQILKMGSEESESKQLTKKLCHAYLGMAIGEVRAKQGRYPEALQSYDEARQTLEYFDKLQTDTGAELLRRIGLAKKFTKDLDGAKMSFEEAKTCRIAAGIMDTIQGADLLKSLGALAQDHFHDLDGAWDYYMEGMLVLCKKQAMQTPSGSNLMMCVGNVLLERLDIENALEIYNEAHRVRSRNGTLQTHPGTYLRDAIDEANSESIVLQLFCMFRKMDTRRMGVLDFGPNFREKLAKIVDLFQTSEDFMKKNHILQGGCFDYRKFLSVVYSESRVVRKFFSETTGGSHMVGPLSHGYPALDPASSTGAHTVLVWNIQSPDHCANALEFLPASDSVSTESLETMKRLLSKAREWMLRPAGTQKLSKLLEDDAPLSKLTDLEKVPLSDAKSLEGLKEWFKSREEVWKKIWPGMTIEDVVREWATRPAERWKYWKQQTLLDWLRDDCSGGKLNPLLLPEKPTVDDVCWDLGLSSADRCLAGDKDRAARARWLQPKPGWEPHEPLSSGRRDFFKLLVWDMILEKICSQAVERAALDRLLEDCRPLDTEIRLRLVVERVAKADLAVLTEVPAQGLSGLDDFWMVSAPASAQVQSAGTYNTCIFARRKLFEKPDVHTFPGKDGGISTRTIGCTLTRLKDSRRLRVIGVHLAGRGSGDEGVFPHIEALLTPNAILAGDFNMDLRKKVPPEVTEASCPRLTRMLQQAANIPFDFGTSNKQRSPFQAQVSKMFLPDFSMKDFAFLGDCFCPSALQGLLPRSEILPSKKVPSDHAALTFQLAYGDTM